MAASSIGERGPAQHVPGIVDQKVEAAEGVDRAPDHGRRGAALGEVGLQQDGTVDGSGLGGLPAVVQRQPGASLGEEARRRRTDAATGPGDQNALAFEARIDRSSHEVSPPCHATNHTGSAPCTQPPSSTGSAPSSMPTRAF
jgi:hypothetical protein